MDYLINFSKNAREKNVFRKRSQTLTQYVYVMPHIVIIFLLFKNPKLVSLLFTRAANLEIVLKRLNSR
jgi:hypothetical protein